MDGVVWNIISILYAVSLLIFILIGYVEFRIFILFGLQVLHYLQFEVLAGFNLGEGHWLSVVITLVIAVIATLVLQNWFPLPDSRSKSLAIKESTTSDSQPNETATATPNNTSQESTPPLKAICRKDNG